MKLYELRPIEDLPEGDNPWDPWYDKCFGFVIRAENEKEAREIAHNNASDENRSQFLGRKIANTCSPWLDNKYSTCVELNINGEQKVIIKEEHWA